MSLRPAAAAQPLRFWRAEQLAQLARLLEKVLRSWAGDWGVAPSAGLHVECHCAAAHDECTGEGTVLRGAEGAAAWFRDGSWTGALAKELFGQAVEPGGMAEEVACACVDDVARRFSLAMGVPEVQAERLASPPRSSRAWTGHVRASLPFDGVLLLNAAAVDACLRTAGLAAQPVAVPRSSTPVPLLQAASELRVSLRAQLETCEVDLGVLQDLQPGDVLRIPHRLDAPLHVRMESGAALFSAYLASSSGRKVLELAGPA